MWLTKGKYPRTRINGKRVSLLVAIYGPLARKKKAFRNNFLLIPSSQLSYILGVRYGDAKLERKTYTIGLEVIDKDFAEEFSRCLEFLLKKNIKIWITKRETCLCKGYSKKLFLFLVTELYLQKPFIEEYPLEFIRGVFDSEGCIGVYPNSTKLSMSMKNKAILTLVKDLLKKKGILTEVHERKNGMFVLQISNRPDIITFYQLINPIIQRKRNVFEKIIEIHKNKKDRGKTFYWTENELDVLAKEYPINGGKILFLLKHHSVYSIRRKASDLRIKYRRKKYDLE